MEGRWKVWVDAELGCLADENNPRMADFEVPVVPCDDAAVERVARVLCRQRGYDWGTAGDGLRAALTAAADQALRAAGETP
jgi:hypothetical protein